jgi:hypothetical protein
MRRLVSLFVLAACVLSAAAVVRADEKPPVPLKVQIVISRYQGEKKISSLPYTLAVNANLGKTSLRLSSQVPIVSSTFAPVAAGDKSPAPLQGFQYKNVGTNIDCTAHSLDDGRFRLDIVVDDSSVIADDRAPKTATGPFQNVPSFLTFTSTNTVILKDGQSMQYTTATDKANGEVTKLDVTLTVLK